MSEPRDRPDVLVEKAAEDQYVLERLAEDAKAPQAVIGFHAQQAVEKCLKAILASRCVPYGRTHDLAGLIDRLRKAGIADPPDAGRLPTLTPYAVELRYGDLPPEPRPPAALDRQWARECVVRTLAWAERLLSKKPDGPEGH